MECPVMLSTSKGEEESISQATMGKPVADRVKGKRHEKASFPPLAGKLFRDE